MSNQVSIEVTANTTQAEQAIVGLTKDVDKLQKKAKESTTRPSSTRKRTGDDTTHRDTQQQRRAADQRRTSDSADLSKLSSSLKDVFGGLGDKISNFGSKIEEVSGGFAELVTTAAALKLAFASAAKRELNSYLDPRVNAIMGRARDATISKMRFYPAAEETAGYKKRVDALIQAGEDPGSDAELNKYVEDYRKNLGSRLLSEEIFGKKTVKPTRDQRLMRAWLQLDEESKGVWVDENTGFKMDFSSPKGAAATQWEGVKNAGKAMGPGRIRAGLKAAWGVGTRGIQAGLNSVGLGALGVGGAAALAVPAVVAGIGVNKVLDAKENGRVKAEELDVLNAKFEQLAKNITGVPVDALSEKIQRLAVEGVVPMDQLSEGASLLMMAFKGNQTETEKWLKIIGDMSAGTGESVQYFSELITRANQFGSVEFEVFNQLNEKGIPIIEQLKGKFGQTRQEIEKAAQAGKITSREFMKAFEAAHKVTMEGANAQMGAASRSSLLEQTAQYKQLEDAAVTRGYDESMRRYDESRRDRAKARSEDLSLQYSLEALGSTVGSVESAFKRLGDFLTDWTDDIAPTVADWMGLDDDRAMHELELREFAINSARDLRNLSTEFMDEKELTGHVNALDETIDLTQRILGNDDFDAETQAYAAEIYKAAKKEREHLDTVLDELAEITLQNEKEKRSAERQQKLDDNRKKTSDDYREWERDELWKNAKTAQEVLDKELIKDEKDLDDRIADFRSMLDQGTATSGDFDRYKELLAIKEVITDINNRNAEEEKRRNEEAQREADAKAATEKAKSDYLTERELARNPENYELKFQQELDAAAEKLKKLGFSADEATEILTEDRAAEIKVKEDLMKKNQSQIEQIEDEIRWSKKTGLGMEANAWGSTGNLYTSFTSPVEEDQLKQLRQINDGIQTEIDALNRLDTRAYAW